MNKKKGNIYFFILTASFFFIYGFLNKNITRPKLIINYQGHSINLKKDAFKIFNFGQKSLTSKLIWIKTLFSLDNNHYKKGDLNSWLFLRLNTITDIDPFFYDPYLFGGQYLSIIKADPLGASIIYDKGLHFFPKDFWLSINAGFNSYFELKKKNESMKYYKNALVSPLMEKFNPGLPNFLAKINYSKNHKKDAFKIMSLSLTNIKNYQLRSKIMKSLYSIKAEIDLNCLNRRRRNCSHSDYFNNLYLFIKGKYKASIDWEPYKI